MKRGRAKTPEWPNEDLTCTFRMQNRLSLFRSLSAGQTTTCFYPNQPLSACTFVDIGERTNANAESAKSNEEGGVGRWKDQMRECVKT